MYIIVFLIILAVLVLVHEFGHFYAAKRSGVRVDEFGLGFPPRLWSKEYKGTTYSMNAVPFGGFVKIFGESPTDADYQLPDGEKGTSFIHKPKWVQVVILAAGVAMNIVFAWALFSIAFMSGMTTGVSQSDTAATDKHVIVLDVLPNSPAAEVGLLAGDEIRVYRAKGAASTTASTVEAIQDVISASNGEPVALAVQRIAEEKYIEVVPERGVLGDKYAVGISMDLVGKVHLPFFSALWEGAKLTYNLFIDIMKGLYGLIAKAFVGEADVSQISGPVGIARLVGDAGKLGFVYLLSFTAFISLNLAVLNLIPFPALDGGRILMVAIEAVIRRPIKPQVANLINAAGFCLLIGFMLFVTYKDIMKLL